ncbi:hypothetical protein [Sphingomonas morindae]|uniref:Uncharacterized protein n=1 Tax=Sphingomonas morindae TaxID=1541170 RepID=A0ABY4X757_9SPHN|nr:hypothetical protein [Sphingomonas morindae]USI72690.1 hypothetical protein LHA26_15645 [Sphingomonas morindae]
MRHPPAGLVHASWCRCRRCAPPAARGALPRWPGRGRGGRVRETGFRAIIWIVLVAIALLASPRMLARRLVRWSGGRHG